MKSDDRTLAAALESPGEVVSRRNSTTVSVVGLAALAGALLGLFYYKWTGSGVVVRITHATGVLKKDPGVLLSYGALRASLEYFKLIWPALAFGLVIGAIVRAALPSRFILRSLGRASGGHWMGALAAAPLMLCSCCITPISAALRERGARLGPSLAVMLGSPGLNVAAWILTFLLFPAHIALARVAAAVLVVFGVSWLIGRLGHEPVGIPRLPPPDEAPPSSWNELLARFFRSLVQLFVATVPLIVIGVVVSSAVLPHAIELGRYGTWVATLVVALVATLVALPTFFEIPIALLLFQLGAPGAALAFLIAGPIVNLPSLFVLARESGIRVACALGGAVFAVAVSAGLLAG